tara:strand:+ start:492 stop:806 length:315 start_codon:yes stop_codon:yes gene_type:complete
MYQLGESKIHGHGLIATKNIKENTDVGLSHLGIGLVNERIIAGETTDIGRFQNHNKNSNCENRIVGKDLHMFTTRNVSSGEELVINFYDNERICINIEKSEHWL